MGVSIGVGVGVGVGLGVGVLDVSSIIFKIGKWCKITVCVVVWVREWGWVWV